MSVLRFLPFEDKKIEFNVHFVIGPECTSDNTSDNGSCYDDKTIELLYNFLTPMKERQIGEDKFRKIQSQLVIDPYQWPYKVCTQLFNEMDDKKPTNSDGGNQKNLKWMKTFKDKGLTIDELFEEKSKDNVRLWFIEQYKIYTEKKAIPEISVLFDYKALPKEVNGNIEQPKVLEDFLSIHISLGKFLLNKYKPQPTIDK